MDCELNGQIAIVTGGAMGIGRSISQTLAGMGASVIIADIDSDSAAKTIATVGSESSFHVKTDVSSEISIKQLYKTVKERFGKVSIVVNNAGIFNMTPIVDIEVAEWDRIMAVNLRGTFLMGREALKIMKSQNNGKIVNIASLAGKGGGINAGAHYAASKAGVICFTKSLARQASPYKINVNAIAPGLIETDLTNAWGREMNASMTAKIPWKEYGHPQDVANAVAFLVSEKARYITGEILDVNGGILMD